VRSGGHQPCRRRERGRDLPDRGHGDRERGAAQDEVADRNAGCARKLADERVLEQRVLDLLQRRFDRGPPQRLDDLVGLPPCLVQREVGFEPAYSDSVSRERFLEPRLEVQELVQRRVGGRPAAGR